MMTTVDITYYKGKLARVEVESLVNPLRDKEPTPVWRKHFRDVLRHFKMTKEALQILAASSDKLNHLGRHYTKNTLDNIIQHYQDKTNGWTPNAQKTVNDHLDVLVDYLSKPIDLFEAAAETLNDTIAKTSEFISKTQTTSLKDSLESTTMPLRERLEKERAEGKWPSVEEKRRTTEEMVELLRKDTPPTAVYTKHEKLTANDIRENFLKTAQRLESFVDVPEKASSKVKLRKIHKRRTHKTHTITININLGR